MPIRSCLLVALLSFTACRSAPQFARVDPALAPLIPADTVLLAGMRIDKLKETPFYKAYVEGQQLRQLEDFAKETGLDPRKDLWELVLASNGKDVPIVLVRGKFGGMFGQEPRFEGLGTERRNYKGYNILGSKQAAVTFMNASVAIAGPQSALERIIDERDKQTVPQSLLSMVGQIPGSSQVWVVTTSGGALIPAVPQEGNIANLARAFSKLQQATLFANLSDGLDLNAAGSYPDVASANQIRDAIKGLIGLGRLTTKQSDVEMIRFYDAIKVTSEDTRVNVSVAAPFELLEKITRQLGLRRAG